MTEHPITPPPNLRRLWAQEAQRMDPHDPVAWLEHVAIQAARWGDGLRLEACCEWVANACPLGTAKNLRAAMRPKPPSVAEEALEAQQRAWNGGSTHADWELIHRALKRLQELEQGNG